MPKMAQLREKAEGQIIKFIREWSTIKKAKQ
jgi:hypothetical protein